MQLCRTVHRYLILNMNREFQTFVGIIIIHEHYNPIYVFGFNSK